VDEMREDELFAIFIKCLLRDMLTAKIMVFFCVLISALFREEEGCDFWVDFGFEGG
jgi:hypothetical protein